VALLYENETYKIIGEHQAQLINYLKASKLEVGLLFNFGSKSLEHKRIIFNVTDRIKIEDEESRG